jgi:hypothetical protein
MQHGTNTKAPPSVTIATQLIWLTLAANALLMAVDYYDTSSDALVFNMVVMVFNGVVAVNIAGCKNWARVAYSVLVALDVALILALGLDQASDLEAIVSYLSLAIEIWILIMLFGAEADLWFRPTRKK